LPLHFDKPLEDFRLQVEVVKTDIPPQVEDEYWHEFYFQLQGDRFVASTHLRQVQPTSLRVTLPIALAPQVLVEPNHQNQCYFCIHDIPAITPATMETTKPERIGILWDASLSRAQADKTREMELVRQLIAQLVDVDVDLIVFRNTTDAPISFAVRGGDAGALIHCLSEITCDGATNFGSLQIPKSYQQLQTVQTGTVQPVADYSYFLLFSDGISNLNLELPIRIEGPIYALSGEVTANHALLNHLAQSSGGAYFNLQQLSDQQVLDKLGQPVFRFLGAEYEPGHLSQVYPVAGQAVQGPFTLVGQLRVPQATITLNYGYGDEVTYRINYTLSQDRVTSTGLVPRHWAQQKIAALMVAADRHQAELIAIGQAFGLVTPGTSLLVLETLEQHLEHRIAPPSSRARLYQQYQQRVRQQQQNEQHRRERKLQQVITLWNQRLDWWQQRLNRPADFRFQPPVLELERGNHVFRSMAEPRTLSRHEPLPASIAGDEISAACWSESVTPAMAMVAPPVTMESADTPAEALPRAARIWVKPWDPNTAYLQALQQAKPAQRYAVYLSYRTEYGQSPAFYFDCADYFFSQGQRELGLRVLSNIVELELESPQLLRIVAYRLGQEGELALAIDLLEKVLRLRPEEPQSYRDLALLLARRHDYQRAIDLLYRVVLGDWDARFAEIELTALLELNQLLAVAQQASIGPESEIDPHLCQLMDLDLRIVLGWDVDLTDIDLWVLEPSGEKCYYGNKRTQIGGLLSRDFTQGYGPEEYLLRQAMPGTYTIQANYFGSSQQQLTGAVTLLATIYTNFGRQDEQRRTITVRLNQTKEVVEIGTVEIPGT
jgi:tetratricopeptide (TPR) repeat protein